MSGVKIGLETIERYDRVDVPALDLELTVVDVLGSYFGQSRTGLVGVDRTTERRYLLAKRDDSDGKDGLRVEQWTGVTYREELRAGSLEASRAGADAVVPQEGSERVEADQPVLAGV